MNKNTAAAIGGIVLEAYNNTLYGYFAVILAPIFFSDEVGVSPITGSFIAFAAGYLARPLGGILFGYLGDKLGRRFSLTISSLLTTIPSFIIAILPTYDSVGFLAPLFLILCRLVQGIAIGGDYTGALIYVAEQKGLKNKSLVSCISASIGFFGASLGILISLCFSTSLAIQGSWRYSFLSAAALGAYISYIRWNMRESHAFEEIQKKNCIEQNPFITALRQDKKKLFACFIFAGANFVPIYLGTVYLNLHLSTCFAFANEEILINNLFVFLISGSVIILSANFLSKWGVLSIMKFSALWFICLSIPIYIASYSNFTTSSLIFLQLFLIVGNAAQISTLAIVLPRLFPTNRRYSAMGFSYALGTATIGGLTPLIASSLVSFTGKLWSPCFYLVFISCLYKYALSIVNTEVQSLSFKDSSFAIS